MICFIFLRWCFANFTAKHLERKALRIVARTARKMWAEARTRAEFEPPPVQALSDQAGAAVAGAVLGGRSF